MTTLREAAQQALECLRGVARGKYDGNAAGVCAALEAALAQQAEPVEPVAWLHNILEDNIIRHRPADLKRSPQNWTPLCNCVQPRQSDPQIADRLARHGIPKP